MRFNENVFHLITIEFYRRPFEFSFSIFEDAKTDSSLFGVFFTKEIGVFFLCFHEFILWEK